MKAWKSQENWHFTGGKFANNTTNYVIICKFTGVARIYGLCEIQILARIASASKVFWPESQLLVRFLCVEVLRQLTDKNIFISSAFLVGFLVVLRWYMFGSAIIHITRLYYCICRKICIVRHCKYGQKLIVHPSHLWLFFGPGRLILRTGPLFRAVLRFCASSMYLYMSCC